MTSNVGKRSIFLLSVAEKLLFENSSFAITLSEYNVKKINEDIELDNELSAMFLGVSNDFLSISGLILT